MPSMKQPPLWLIGAYIAGVMAVPFIPDGPILLAILFAAVAVSELLMRKYPLPKGDG